MNKQRGGRVLRAAAVLAVLAGSLLFLVFVWKPPCLIRSLTGLYCPGCGGQRMVWALAAGDIPGAFRYNPLLFFLLPAAAVYALAEAVRYGRGRPPLARGKRFTAVLIAVLAVTLAFMVLRNLPGLEVLRP